MRIAVGMGLVLALAACGGKQAKGPAPGAASPPQPVVASGGAPAAATTVVDPPVEPAESAEPAASPPSDAPADEAAVPGDSAPVGTGDDSAGAPPPSGSGSGGSKIAAELTAEAQTAAKAAQWGRALTLAEQALRARPDAGTKLTAVTTAALAACNLKNLAKARQHYAQLPATRQLLIRQRCLANGVNLAP